ncbi:MAG: ElyC/SanA/YdcF family protein [Candidatus Nanohalobium sp.]
MSSESNVLVAIHGYSPEGMEGGKDPETVWRDRLTKGLEVVGKLEKMGVNLSVAISGAGDYNGKTEAEMVEEFAEEEFRELADNYEIIEEDRSENTEENVVQLHRIARKLGAELAFVVSSRDHVPRVLRDWEEHIRPSEDLILSAVGSDKTYASSGKDPFILEAAMYEPFVEAFNEVWQVDEENYSKAAEEVKEVLQKHQ